MWWSICLFTLDLVSLRRRSKLCVIVDITNTYTVVRNYPSAYIKHIRVQLTASLIIQSRTELNCEHTWHSLHSTKFLLVTCTTLFCLLVSNIQGVYPSPLWTFEGLNNFKCALALAILGFTEVLFKWRRFASAPSQKTPLRRRLEIR